MRALWGIVIFAVALAAQAQDRTLSVSSREAGERLALVIGNSAYKVGPLRNPANDARAMAAALRSSGFEVMHGENLSYRRLFEMTRDFGRKLNPGVVALFYYAGHGLQVRDRNFLIPVEADPQSEEEVPYTSVDVNFLLDVMNRARSRVNIVILDACRNNPFARSFRSGSSGLAQMDAPSGTLIAYATAPGRVASDGTGEHGLYTQHLLAHLTTPGLPIEILFKRVREGVERATESQQVPWESSSLKGDFSFVAAEPAAPAAPAQAAAPAPDAAFELAFWDSIKASSQVADYRAYLTEYPDGRFAVLAKARIATLAPAAQPAAPRPPSPQTAPAPTPPSQLAAIAPSAMVTTGAPVVGDKWIYRYADLWTPVKGLLTAEVLDVKGGIVTESVTIELDGRQAVGQTEWPFKAEIRGWDAGVLGLRELSPYALALELLKPERAAIQISAEPLEEGSKRSWSLDTEISEEEVQVPAGRFRSTKLVVKGVRQATPGAAGAFEMVVWYAPETKRYVKLSYMSYLSHRGFGSSTDPWHRYVYELVSAPR